MTLTSSLRTWAEMVKLSHSVFAMPFALMAAFLAGRNLPGRSMPEWGQLGLVVLCMVAARSVAMTFNRIVDAQIDARNQRTAQRPIPAGKLSMAASWGMLGLSAITFFIGCLGFYFQYDNTWPVLLSGPVLLYLCSYSFAKRFTRWSHYFLGSALALSPLAAWLAIHPESVGSTAIYLMVAVTGWVGGFDIIYACQDIEIDRREGLHSLPSKWGPHKALWLARFSHLVAVLALLAVGVSADLGTLYYIGVGIAAVLLTVENAMVRAGDYHRVNLAFFTINGLVSIAVGGLTVVDILLAGQVVGSGIAP